MIAALAGATFGMSTLSSGCTWFGRPGRACRKARKAEIAANYNDANHAQKAHDMAGCLTSIEKAEAAIKSGH
jgi:hypothetical protein